MIRKVLFAASAASLLTALPGAGGESQPMAARFQGYDACALVVTRDRHRERRLEFGSELCDTPLPPCSTFKIPNALIGLQSGMVSGPGDRRNWDGVERRVTTWNQDHTLATAMRDSVVWYFQELARDVGAERMAFWLEVLDYGNQDMSAGIDQFWLGSSLRIDPRSQLAMIKRLTHTALPFKTEHQQQVRDMLKLESDLAGQLHGKTGSCPVDSTGATDAGWFVGWVDWQKSTDRNPVITWFVVALVGDGASGLRASQITRQLLNDLQP